MSWSLNNKSFIFFIIIIILFNIVSCNSNNDNKLTFVQLCDTQLGMGGYQHDINAFNQAVKQINHLKPDFVVFCGDLVNEANDTSYNDFKNILDKINVPTYLAPGNHDVGNKPDSITLKYYREKIGKDYYLFKESNINFIVVNTQLWKVNIPIESEKHQIWFEKSLKLLAREKSPIIIIGHYPLFIKEFDEEENYFNIPKSNRKKILNLMENQKVRVYISGHKHEFIENIYKDILMVSGESTSKNFDNRPLGFRIWTSKINGNFKHHFISLDEL